MAHHNHTWLITPRMTHPWLIRNDVLGYITRRVPTVKIGSEFLSQFANSLSSATDSVSLDWTTEFVDESHVSEEFENGRLGTESDDDIDGDRTIEVESIEWTPIEITDEQVNEVNKIPTAEATKHGVTTPEICALRRYWRQSWRTIKRNITI